MKDFAICPPEGAGQSNDGRDVSEYRQFAERLRQLAEESRFNLCRRNQLLALADGFERFAARREGRLGQAAD